MSVKAEPYTPQWERKANELVRSYVLIYPCHNCGWPVMKPYCCTFCQSTNPEGG
jgi:hypothetical protein